MDARIDRWKLREQKDIKVGHATFWGFYLENPTYSRTLDLQSIDGWMDGWMDI